MTSHKRITDRRIGVVGMARSGLAAARLATRLKGQPFVSDSGDTAKLRAQCDELLALGVPFETGGHADRLLTCDYLVVSPGVPQKAEILAKAREKGIPIFSEIEYASWVCQGPIVAVTGANGKTTTTTLLGEIFTAAGYDTYVCGNIGKPFADVALDVTEESVAVVEVSSFQLETIDEFHPEVALILNLTPDHIDRHGSFEAYRQAKYRITENQTAEDALVLNYDDNSTMADNPSTAARKQYFTIRNVSGCNAWVEEGALWAKRDGKAKKIIACDEIAIKGPHNLQNAAAATVAAMHYEIDPDTVARVLKTFPGVEHRIEKVAVVAGVTFVNDSKATNVDSVRWALRSMTTPVYLIAGGRDKGGIFADLIPEGEGKIKSIVAIGEASRIIFDAMGKAFPVQFAGSLQEAVEKCFEMANPGETVLLSPGCASFDMFDNYEHRGRVFKEAVATLRNGKNHAGANQG